MSYKLLKEDGGVLLKEDGGAILLETIEEIIQKAVGGVLSFAGSVAKKISKNTSGTLAFQGVVKKTTSKVLGGTLTFIGTLIARLVQVGRRLKMRLFKRPYLDMVVETKPYHNLSVQTREVKP
jgi:hypothetical protein